MGKVKAFLVVALVVVFLTPAAVVVADEAERELGLEKKHRKAEEERVADAQPGGGSGGPAPGGGVGKGWPAQGRGGGGGGGGWPTPGGGGGGGGGDGRPTPGGGGGGGRGWPTPGGGGGGGEWPTPSGGGGGGGGGEGRPTFILQDVRQVMSSPAGELKVARGQSWRFRERPLHIGFISMEPKSLFIPQYWDSDLIIFVHRGEARIGLIYKDDLVEKRLKKGDLYRISTGSTFYILNRAEGQRLYIICGIDSSMGLGLDTFQSFFVGGGINAPSVLAGFDPITLSTALNVSLEDIREVLTGNKLGPFVFVNTTHDTHDELSKWAKITASMTGSWDMDEDEDEDREDEHSSEWSWRKMLLSFLPSKKNKRGDDKGDDKGPDPFNIYDDKDPDFQNDYGSSLIVNKNDYKPLKKSKVSVFHVNLSAGSMMAPHLNPRAAEYTIVLRGKGSVEVVYPNGTLAMNAMVKEGDVFWIPQFFPFCQIASRSGPFEFFGFSTSSRRNRPQFLAGSSSILRTLLGPELAASYGMSEDRFRRFVGAQPRSVIFPPKNTSVPVGPPVGPPLPPRPKEKTRVESEGRLQTTIRSRMAMVFE